jgi:hypothetical protein
VCDFKRAAKEFGINKSMKMAGLLVFITDIHSLGLRNTEGLMLTTSWDWNLNDKTREFGKKFFAKTKRMPTDIHAADYSATMNYLKAVQAAGGFTLYARETRVRLVRDKTAYDKVSCIVKADDFAVEANRLMYAAMENMILHGQPVDPITLSSELDSRGELSAVGGLAVIGEVYGGYSTPNPHRYAETVRDLSRERAMLIAINDAHAMLHGTGDTQEKLASVAEVVMSAAETGQHDVHVTSARDMSQAALKAIIERSEAGEEGLSLGFVDVERMTGKLKAGQLIIIAGRPGMGKSTLARNIAEHVAAQTGVLFVSLEMDADGTWSARRCALLE